MNIGLPSRYTVMVAYKSGQELKLNKTYTVYTNLFSIKHFGLHMTSSRSVHTYEQSLKMREGQQYYCFVRKFNTYIYLYDDHQEHI